MERHIPSRSLNMMIRQHFRRADLITRNRVSSQVIQRILECFLIWEVFLLLERADGELPHALRERVLPTIQPFQDALVDIFCQACRIMQSDTRKKNNWLRQVLASSRNETELDHLSIIKLMRISRELLAYQGSHQVEYRRETPSGSPNRVKLGGIVELELSGSFGEGVSRSHGEIHLHVNSS